MHQIKDACACVGYRHLVETFLSLSLVLSFSVLEYPLKIQRDIFLNSKLV